ncbi:MAG: glycosyltransferase family 4 protein [Cyanophyceae cyanobacterium]
MRKLLVLPGTCDSLGGMIVSFSMLIKGFHRCQASEQLCFLVRAGSLVERYLQHEVGSLSLHSINASNQTQFVKQSLSWVSQQPKDWPLLLENCVNSQALSTLAFAAIKLRLSGRPIYYSFHDQARSYNLLGNLVRKLTFTCLSPRAICNSEFTASRIRALVPHVCGILYPAVDLEERFNPRLPVGPPPAELQPILNSGARVMLTASRISKPGGVNDKNLRALFPVLAQLKAKGHHYHGVVIGLDTSPEKCQTRALLEQAEIYGIADRFTVLPPTFTIKDYYNYTDVLVTLAPREPFGLTVVEAIACGVPVVGSETGGVGESLRNIAPEWTVNPENPTAVADTIIRVASDPHTPQLLSQGRRWVEAHCSPVEYAKKIIDMTELNEISLPLTLKSAER